MSKINLKIIQNNTNVEQVTSDMIDKLYSLAYEEGTEAKISSTSEDIVGNINAPAAYEDAILYLRQKFPNLVISVTDNTYYVRFEDPEAKRVVVEALTNKGYSAELTSTNLAKLTDISFSNNTTVTTLNDLQHLTGITRLDWNRILGCSNATSIILPPNIVTMKNIDWCTSLKEIRLPEYMTGEFRMNACTALELCVVDGTMSSLSFGQSSWKFTCPSNVVIRGSLETFTQLENRTSDPSSTVNIWVNNVEDYQAKEGFADYINRLLPISEMPTSLAERVENIK